jgi:glycosyltransferase involved in cell wall biosynthesis
LARIWIDVEDLFQYMTGNPRPSGIQRLAFELQRALRTRLGGEQVRFLRHVLPGTNFAEVPWEDVEALFQGLTEHRPPAQTRPPPEQQPRMEPVLRSRLRGMLYRLPVPIRIALINYGRAQLAAIRAQVDALRRIPAIFRALFARAPHAPHAPLAPRPASVPNPGPFAGLAHGDVLAVLGSPWFSTDYAAMLRKAKARHGVKVVLLIYDLIPIRHPEWCDRSLVQTFVRWFETCLPEGDVILAISQSTARDVERYAAGRALKLPGPVRSIPIGTGFGKMPVADASAGAGNLPEPGSYVLFVSTIEARKNHRLLFRVWRGLLDELPPARVPTLVFAGRIGWLVHDFMQQLRNAAWLDGKIVLIEDPTDAELVRLYRGCLFTVFPSLYEGWGLPVTESLAFGKPCVISNATSLPEAGGALARYFDPEDIAGATRVIRATIEDRAGLAAWEAQVATEFRPVPWDVTASALLAALERPQAGANADAVG